MELAIHAAEGGDWDLEHQVGMVETRRSENGKGKFTLVFLAAPKDLDRAEAERAPELELTYN